MGRSAVDDDDNGFGSGSAYIFESVRVSPKLTLTGTCPGEMELVSTGTTPLSAIRLFNSTAPGASILDSGPCEGTLLDLDRATVMGQANVDLDAEKRRLRTVDASQCGIYLQVIDLQTCLTSEVVQVP